MGCGVPQPCNCQYWGLVLFSHQHMGRMLGRFNFWVGCGKWLVLGKCGAGVWISIPGLSPLESDAQCLLSETWLCFRPDGPIPHLREPCHPRAQISLSFLFSSLISSSFSTPSYLSFIRSLSPLFSFPFMSCCVPLWTSFPSVSYFSPYYHPHVPCLFLCSASLLSSPPTLASVIISSSFRLYGRMSERQNQINLCSWPLAPMTSSVASGDISIQIQLRESAVCHVE